MFKRIAATVLFLTIAAAAAFGAKTVFIDGIPAQGIKGTKVTAEFLNKTSYNVPTGEDLEGSAPLLYAADTGAANAYVVNLTQGKKRATGTNTSTTTNKLVDSGATFQTAAVVVGDVVLNVTDKTSATVTAIDSQTQLSLSSNIFTATSKSYAVGPNIQQLPQAYTAGLTITFKAANANTGAATINVNSLGVKTIKKNGSTDITVGEILSGQITELRYDGTNFQLISRSVTSVTPAANTVPVRRTASPYVLDAAELAMTGETSAENAGVVTILSSPTTVVTLDLGSVTAGDRFFVSGVVRLTKGATAGKVALWVNQNSGTATVQTGHNDTWFTRSQDSVTASAGMDEIITGIFKIVSSGTLVIAMQGTSAGSNSSVSAGNGELYTFFLKKQ